MSERKRKNLLLIGLFLIILLTPFSTLVGLLLYKPARNRSPNYINGLTDETSTFALGFQNPDGLFLEPTIDTLYHAAAIHLYLNDSDPFYFSNLNHTSIAHYVFTHQNPDGGYSDIAYMGNTHSTFEALATLNWTDPSKITDYPDHMNQMYDFINSSRNTDGGYMYRPPLELPEEFNFDLGLGIPTDNLTSELSTLESTYHAIASLTTAGLVPPNTLSTVHFINDTLVGCRRDLVLSVGYAPTKYSLLPDLHSAYYAIATLADLGYDKAAIDPDGRIEFYINSCYNFIEGGFAMYPLNASDVVSTYYGVAALELLDFDYTTSMYVNKTRILEFIYSAQNADGGFGVRNGSISNIASAHHAAASLSLLNATLPAGNRTNLHEWLVARQALNGLFGDAVVESQYWGVVSAALTGKLSSLNTTSLSAFLSSCQNLNGGFGAIPGANSTVVDGYAAIEALARLNHLADINNTAAALWLQSLQTEVGGFASEISIDSFLSRYGAFFAEYAEHILDPRAPSTEATLFALAALNRLNVAPLNTTSLRLWLLSSQNADGGFPFRPGIRSDAISTFYAIQALAILNEVPYSSISCAEFLLGCQVSDGGFTFYPLIGDYLDLSYLFIGFTASKALYLLRTQPEDVFGAMNWFLTCQDNVTAGYGDAPNFGADLRNSPYFIDIIGELNIDRSFDPAPWIQTVLGLMVVTYAALGSFSVIKLVKRRQKGPVGITQAHPNLAEYPAVHVKGLTIKIGKKVILEDVSMTLQDGEVLGVIGESGAGKSTFVKSILGTKASIGEIKIYGFDIRKEKKQLKPLFGYVPQDLSKIYENFTLMENLLHFGKQYGLAEADIIKRGANILRDLGILQKKDSVVSELSGGQRRRASIAIGMIHQPKLFVLDEPTSGLDPIIREQLWINLIELAETHHTTLIVITHYPEESKFCTRVAIFGRKRGLIDFGHPRELIQNLPGRGRAVDIILSDQIQRVHVDLLPILEKVPQIEFILEEKKGSRYRAFTNLPVQTLKDILTQALGTSLIELKQSDATLVDYFRIKSLEVKD
jgi:ABC-type multidrug transport system ATPase subunit/prenyltransferase beta subunit